MTTTLASEPHEHGAAPGDSVWPAAPDSRFADQSAFGGSAAAGPTPRIGWRRQALLLAAVVACLTVFLLARVMANNPHVAADWRVTLDGGLELVYTNVPLLKEEVGRELASIETAAPGSALAFDALALTHSARWLADDAQRERLIATRLAVSRAVEAGHVVFIFRDGHRVDVVPRPRGYAGLGAMFWLLSAFAMVLFLVGWIVPLVQPQLRNLLYALMALSQAGQLLLAAIGSVPALALPSALVLREHGLLTLLDLVTGAAVLHATALHPYRSRWRTVLVTASWAATLAFGAYALVAGKPYHWWSAQSVLIGDGLLCIAFLFLPAGSQPHPFAVVMRRFASVTVGALVLLTLAVALVPRMPPDVQPLAAVGPVVWSVFFASVVLMVPFISRSQNVMREFAMLAGVSTVATSVDLLFIAVSFSQFQSFTLSLLLALGAYAAVRQWLVNQMMGARTLTTERMFEHLYRIAREVEAKPERAAERMADLLRHVFEPLETARTGGQARASRVVANGAVLLVPVPNLTQGPMLDGQIALRFAERGKRLFTPEDARLADRIVEQLMRALAHDRAVERGRTEERVRIAQDLHDDIGARLLTLMYKAPSKEMEDYCRHTLQDLKTLTRGLAASTHSLALAAAEWKTDITARLEAARCELEWVASFDEDLTLTMIQWSSLTRILRELISNAIAHSKASKVLIEVRLHEGAFTITMSDDGVGRDPAKWSHGLGLGGIRKRVKLMGGSVAWREREPHGIVCQVNVPRLDGVGAAKG